MTSYNDSDNGDLVVVVRLTPQEMREVKLTSYDWRMIEALREPQPIKHYLVALAILAGRLEEAYNQGDLS